MHRGRGGRHTGRGNGGHGRHGNYQGHNKSAQRRIFTKLLKDEAAVFRNRNDVSRFLEGMESFGGEEAVHLLMKLDDKRDQGSRRILELMSYVNSVDEVEEILIRFLRLVLTTDTGRPMYVPVRNRILNTIFVVPMLVQTLSELEAARELPKGNAALLCTFFKEVACSSMEARGNFFLIDIARQFQDREDIDSRALRSLVLVDKHDSVLNHKDDTVQKSYRLTSVVWANDERLPGGRHDNDHPNFRTVRNLPTAQELSCEVRPWLPLATGQNNFVNDPVTRIISNDFRLLREDAIYAMKEQMNDGRRSWKNAKIVDLEVSMRKGAVEFVVQCDPKKRKVNWEFSRALSHGSVVAFCKDGSPSLMGAIGTRDVKLLASNGGPKIGVSFDSHGDHFKEALNVMLYNSSQLERCDPNDDSNEETTSATPNAPASLYEMIEVSSSFAT